MNDKNILKKNNKLKNLQSHRCPSNYPLILYFADLPEYFFASITLNWEEV